MKPDTISMLFLLGSLTLTLLFLWTSWKSLKQQSRFKPLLLVNLILLSIAGSTFLAVSPHVYKDVRLDMLNLDTNAMNDRDRYAKVSPSNQKEARQLYNSLGGVGWPISAGFIFVFLSLPFSLIVWLVTAIVYYFWISPKKTIS